MSSQMGILYLSWKTIVTVLVGFLLLFLAIKKEYEPLLLLPIGTGIVLTNIPLIGMMEPHGVLWYIYEVGIKTEMFPLLIFLGVGALTDFGPLLANPKTALLGAGAQFGIFFTLIGALSFNIIPGFDAIHFTLQEAAAIGIIGGADGPTSIYIASKLADHMLGAIAIAAYSYMALVPIIQPPIIRMLTTEKERKIRMNQLRHVSKLEKILFPLVTIFLCAMFVPSATPLIGMLMFGNLLKESGVVERLSKAAQNELLNVTTIFLGLAVGGTVSGESFLNFQNLGIMALGLIAFTISTMSGILIAKTMNFFSKTPINPMIGSAGVSAVPMAARVVQKEGTKADPNNYLLMHAMGPNVAGVIGSAVAAGVMIALL
ncbi:MAG: sodium ion-translocating decarboxylase subunit beta [Nitrospinae bacterium]|nr:sodium ion-translocating decarboxylase subunit beta [Nitrospinota bacterium]